MEDSIEEIDSIFYMIEISILFIIDYKGALAFLVLSAIVIVVVYKRWYLKEEARINSMHKLMSLNSTIRGVFFDKDEAIHGSKDAVEQENNINPYHQLKHADALFRDGKFDKSCRAYEELLEREDIPRDMKEKALYKAAFIMEEMGLVEAAEIYYRRFLEEFPHSTSAEKVKIKLSN